MATSGTISKTIRTGYVLRIVWNVDSQSVANNTSSVTAKVQLVSTGSSYTINSSATKSGSLTINGTKYSFTFSAALSGNQTKTIFTKTVTIAHNADGTKTCSFATTCGINVTLSGTYYGNVTASGNGVFNTIARASTIASVTSSVSVNGTNTCAVSITRASSSFTHTVKFSFGSYSNTKTGVGTSTSYAIPLTWLNAMPSATSGKATVTVTTYSGSTKIGNAVSKTFTLTVPSNIVPSISSVSISEAVSGINAQFAGYVQNKSKLAVTVSAAGTYSSTIKSYKTTILGKSYTSASFTSSILSNSGNVNLAISVTDSRGRTTSTTRSISVLAYSPPTIAAFTGFRALQDGTENYEGTFLNASINFSISAVGNKNTKSYVIEYKLQSASTWTSLSSGSVYSMNDDLISAEGFLNVNNSYDVRLSITDFFGTVRQTIEIPTAFTLIDYNSSGRALAFGKVSEKSEGIEFALKTYFSNGETPSSSSMLQEGQDLNDVLEPGFYTITTTAISNSLINKPWGAGSTGCVMVIAEGNGGQRLQIAYKCTKDDSKIYERHYYTNAWGAWHTVYNGGDNILWTGGMYMTGGHRITLAEPVSKQPNGIVLVFSRYDGGVVDHNFNSFFVHKAFVAAKPGVGSAFQMNTVNISMFATKYLYINDETITGNDSNDDTGTVNGVTYNNAAYVLRYVIGV